MKRLIFLGNSIRERDLFYFYFKDFFDIVFYDYRNFRLVHSLKGTVSNILNSGCSVVVTDIDYFGFSHYFGGRDIFLSLRGSRVSCFILFSFFSSNCIDNVDRKFIFDRDKFFSRYSVGLRDKFVRSILRLC